MCLKELPQLNVLGEPKPKMKGYVVTDENNRDPIGEPEPIEPHKGRKILRRFLAGVVVAIGGVLTFATLQSPTAVRGATRSARLRWQQRDKEIQDAIAADASAQTNAVAAGLLNQPAGSGSK